MALAHLARSALLQYPCYLYAEALHLSSVQSVARTVCGALVWHGSPIGCCSRTLTPTAANDKSSFCWMYKKRHRVKCFKHSALAFAETMAKWSVEFEGGCPSLSAEPWLTHQPCNLHFHGSLFGCMELFTPPLVYWKTSFPNLLWWLSRGFYKPSPSGELISMCMRRGESMAISKPRKWTSSTRMLKEGKGISMRMLS